MKERIKQIRRREMLSQYDLADIMGVTRSTLANYESGRYEPPQQFINLFCKEFRINKDWFVTGEGEIDESFPCGDVCLASLFADLTLSKNTRLRKLLFKVGKLDEKYYDSL